MVLLGIGGGVVFMRVEGSELWMTPVCLLLAGGSICMGAEWGFRLGNR